MGFDLKSIAFGALPGSLGDGGGGSQDSQLGQITRDQWADYKTRFLPIKTKLYDMATGNADNLKSEQQALGAATSGFNSAMGSLGRARSRLGQTLTTEEKADESRINSGLSTALQVGALNKARLHSQDRDLAILNGASLGAGL